MIKQNKTQQNHFWSHLPQHGPLLCAAFVKELSTSFLTSVSSQTTPLLLQLCSCPDQQWCQDLLHPIGSPLILPYLTSQTAIDVVVYSFPHEIFSSLVLYENLLFHQVLCLNSFVITFPLLNLRMSEFKGQVLGLHLYTYNSLHRWFIQCYFQMPSIWLLLLNMYLQF